MGSCWLSTQFTHMASMWRCFLLKAAFSTFQRLLSKSVVFTGLSVNVQGLENSKGEKRTEVIKQNRISVLLLSTYGFLFTFRNENQSKSMVV